MRDLIDALKGTILENYHPALSPFGLLFWQKLTDFTLESFADLFKEALQFCLPLCLLSAESK